MARDDDHVPSFFAAASSTAIPGKRLASMPCSWAIAASGNNAMPKNKKRRNGQRGDMKSVPRREKGAELVGSLEFSGRLRQLSKRFPMRARTSFEPNHYFTVLRRQDFLPL